MLILQSRIVGAFNSFDAQYNFLRFTGVECAALLKHHPSPKSLTRNRCSVSGMCARRLRCLVFLTR